MQYIIQFLGVLLGGGIVGLIEFFVNRSDRKSETDSEVLKAISRIDEKISALDERMDKENADEARRNILIFDDELRRELGHSEESYNQVIDDINFYRRYCHEHPLYENSKAENATAHILSVYTKDKANNNFL